MRSRILLVVALPAAVLTAVFGVASPATAHDALASADPAANSSISGDLDRVTLTFSEPPLAGLESGIVISVTGPGGAEASTGTVRIDGSTLTKSVNLAAPGSYTLTWRSVSVDGHPISGSYPFASTGTVPSPVSASPAPTATGSTTPTATASMQARPEAERRTPAMWVLGGLTALFIAAVVGILLITRRRPKAPE